MLSRKIFLLAFVVVLVFLSGCDKLLKYGGETLYTWRPVGMCNGEYVGEWHTPNTHITNCTNLLISELMLRVNLETQSVIIYETSLPAKNTIEVIHTDVTTLRKCSVLDRDNFNCELLSRKAGDFVDTRVFLNRRISGSWIARQWSRIYGGWVDAEKLDFAESTFALVIGWALIIILIIVLASQ
jgi:hypothetical protein